MTPKKYYLTVGQRDRIIADILSEKRDLENALKAEPPKSGIIRDLADIANQERDMLVALFKVEESERE
jgi:hypothetical protein